MNIRFLFPIIYSHYWVNNDLNCSLIGSCRFFQSLWWCRVIAGTGDFICFCFSSCSVWVGLDVLYELILHSLFKLLPQFFKVVLLFTDASSSDGWVEWSMSIFVKWLLHHFVYGGLVKVPGFLDLACFFNDNFGYCWLVGEILLSDVVHDAWKLVFVLWDALFKRSECALAKVELIDDLVKSLLDFWPEHLVCRPDCCLAEDWLLLLLWRVKRWFAAITRWWISGYHLSSDVLGLNILLLLRDVELRLWLVGKLLD